MNHREALRSAIAAHGVGFQIDTSNYSFAGKCVFNWSTVDSREAEDSLDFGNPIASRKSALGIFEPRHATLAFCPDGSQSQANALHNLATAKVAVDWSDSGAFQEFTIRRASGNVRDLLTLELIEVVADD